MLECIRVAREAHLCAFPVKDSNAHALRSTIYSQEVRAAHHPRSAFQNMVTRVYCMCIKTCFKVYGLLCPCMDIYPTCSQIMVCSRSNKRQYRDLALAGPPFTRSKPT